VLNIYIYFSLIANHVTAYLDVRDNKVVLNYILHSSRCCYMMTLAT